MIDKTSLIYLVGGLLLLWSMLSALRYAFLNKMMEVPERAEETVDLRPVELAYLLRPADTAHSLIVLIVDLVQRGAKSPSIKEMDLLPYEREVWHSVTVYLKDWADRKTQEVVPAIKTGNPLRIAWGIWGMRTMVAGAVKGVLGELARDPTNIKRYLSPGGIMRLFMDLWGSGVKDAVRGGVRQSLLSRGLLVGETPRLTCGRAMAALAVTGAAAAVVLLCATLDLRPGLEAIAILGIPAAVNAMVLKTMMSVWSFIPFYDEVSLVLASVDFSTWRTTVLRQVLKFLRAIVGAVIASVAIALVLSETLFAFFLDELLGWIKVSLSLQLDNFWLILGLICLLTALFLSIADLILESVSMFSQDQLSVRARNLVKRYKTELKEVSPVESLVTTVTRAEYNEQFSDLVALYGIETLLILA